MKWYINDSSIQGQFETAEAFLLSLMKVVLVRWKLKDIHPQLFCTQLIWQRPVTDKINVFKAVLSSGRDTRHLIKKWIDEGPFIEDNQQEELDDRCEFEGENVTCKGLGEAARREHANDPSGVFSFTGGQINFERNPLVVLYSPSKGPSSTISIFNTWDAQKLESCLNENPLPRSWKKLLELCQKRFNHLEISDDILKVALAGEPFKGVIAKNIESCLNVLQEIMSNRSDGKMTDAAKELWKKHSHGDNALFSDESKTNKRKFKKELTFRDPSDPPKSIFCPWHAKISPETFRIHFQWPVPRGQTRLKVLYIGRKITRK